MKLKCKHCEAHFYTEYAAQNHICMVTPNAIDVMMDAALAYVSLTSSPSTDTSSSDSFSSGGGDFGGGGASGDY